MSDIPSIRRKLKIQTGVTKRLYKDHNLYQKEAADQKHKLDELLIADEAENPDLEWNIKNAGKVLDEANKMIKDSANRLEEAVAKLRDAVAAAKDKPDFQDSDELRDAEETIEKVALDPLLQPAVLVDLVPAGEAK